MIRTVKKLALSLVAAIAASGLATGEFAFMGVTTQGVDDATGKQLGLIPGLGLAVKRVTPGSPAAGAIKVDDILTKIGDQLLVDERQLQVLMQVHAPGDSVDVELWRAGEKQTVRLELGKRSDHAPPGLLRVQEHAQIAGKPMQAFVIGDGSGAPESEVDLRPHLPMILSRLSEAMRKEEPLTFDAIGNAVREMNKELSARQQQEGADKAAPSSLAGFVMTSMVDARTGATLTMIGRKLRIIDAGGDQVFSGAVGTPEEQAAIPELYRSAFEELTAIIKHTSGEAVQSP